MGYVKDPRAAARGGQINESMSQKKSEEDQQREAMVHLRPPSPVHYPQPTLHLHLVLSSKCWRLFSVFFFLSLLFFFYFLIKYFTSSTEKRATNSRGESLMARTQ